MQDSPTLVPVSELIGICIDIEQPDTIIFVPNVPSSTPLESAGTTTMSNVSACTPPLLILETCNTQWRYSELPEHVLVLVFSYLRRHEIARGEKRVVRGEWPETDPTLTGVQAMEQCVQTRQSLEWAHTDSVQVAHGVTQRFFQ